MKEFRHSIGWLFWAIVLGASAISFALVSYSYQQFRDEKIMLGELQELVKIKSFQASIVRESNVSKSFVKGLVSIEDLKDSRSITDGLMISVQYIFSKLNLDQGSLKKIFMKLQSLREEVYAQNINGPEVDKAFSFVNQDIENILEESHSGIGPDVKFVLSNNTVLLKSYLDFSSQMHSIISINMPVSKDSVDQLVQSFSNFKSSLTQLRKFYSKHNKPFKISDSRIKMSETTLGVIMTKSELGNFDLNLGNTLTDSRILIEMINNEVERSGKTILDSVRKNEKRKRFQFIALSASSFVFVFLLTLFSRKHARKATLFYVKSKWLEKKKTSPTKEGDLSKLNNVVCELSSMRSKMNEVRSMTLDAKATLMSLSSAHMKGESIDLSILEKKYNEITELLNEHSVNTHNKEEDLPPVPEVKANQTSKKQVVKKKTKKEDIPHRPKGKILSMDSFRQRTEGQKHRSFESFDIKKVI